MPRSLATASILLAVLLLPSCVTASVWGGGLESNGDGTSSLNFSGDTPLSSSPWVNAIATPFALALDVCLAPIQACFYGAKKNDEDWEIFD